MSDRESITTYTDDGEAVAEWFARTQREVEILQAHYATSENPLFVWKAILLFSSRHAGTAYPRWVQAYLHDVAAKLMDLGEGIDFSRAPTTSLPKSATREQITAAARKQQEFRDNPSLDWAKAGALALKALKLAGRKKLNRFTQYAETLQRQHEAQEARWQREVHDAARKAKKTRETFIVQKTPPGGDQSGTAKKLRRNERLLKRGEVSPDPFGPERARRLTSLFGRKKGFNSSSE